MTMATRKLTGFVATALLVLGFHSQGASAMEEVVAYGAEDAAVARQSRELFRSERQDYIRSLDHELTATLGEDLSVIRAPRLRLASLELPNRG